MEQRGVVSVWRVSGEEERPGLRVMPPWDAEPPEYFSAGDALETEQTLGCERCGDIRSFDRGERLPSCRACGGDTWVDAVVWPSRADAATKS